MAPGSIMTAPICLVENEQQQLRVNREALSILEEISEPVVVVAIAGLYRTGKSYLMNRLAGQNHGFPLGSTVQSQTKGIWMWCVPHPSKPDHTLVLLDTEGLGDVEKGDPKNDLWIFTLAVLLSSMFVYNSIGAINRQALEQLHYVTELAKFIKIKSSPSSDENDDSAEFVSFFPDFVWTLRDLVLELELHGHSITEDEYLENALKLTKGDHPRTQMSNLPRECIRKFFPKRKCFVFDRPTSDSKLLLHMEEVSENQLDLKFQEQSQRFCSYIFTHGKAKNLMEGITVTGNGLGTLIVTYVDTISCGSVPCLEDAVTTLALLKNPEAVQKAANHYSLQMVQRVLFPTDTLQELLDLHAACEREAISVFMEHSFKDDQREFQKMLVETIQKKKEEFLLQNEDVSCNYCQAELRKLSKSLMESVSRGTFCVPGGHSLYLEAKNKVMQDYELVPRKGVKAKEVLQSFLQSQAATEESILQADKALTDGEKAIAAERAKKEAAEQEKELLKQKQKEQQQIIEAQERSYKENICQLKEKMEREKDEQLREQEMVLEHRLKMQNEILTEGFKKKYEQMNEEINHLREVIRQTRSNASRAITDSLLQATGYHSEICSYRGFQGNGQLPDISLNQCRCNESPVADPVFRALEKVSEPAHLDVLIKITMAPGYIMTAPICLVENEEQQLRVKPEALSILEKISEPVVVVAIAGLYHKGRSYLMNSLAGQNHGYLINSITIALI
ncbi:PREDICTED: guanylate-binding protein 4-like [Condylura cristata]|uniref:guanylate-binding protein 4-like n=1 Tax=Condylura cristata TaxID=143302 RepID=UPI000643B597|nr:PREDICTED: guanylate-binding protein 4-like [Condylura cristata]